MTKTSKICEKCDTPLEYSRKLREWFCPQCAFGAHLTDLAQREAVKRYRQSEKGKKAEKRYEQSEKGKTARERYLKSAKYKQRRKEYNLRLKESLAIARAAMPERAKALSKEEVLLTDDRAAIIQDIREFIDSSFKTPSTASVKTLGEEYNLRLTDEQARDLIQRAQRH